MILFLCYAFPPMAVLFMGRPFSAIVNSFFTLCMWAPGVNHALVHYADYKSTRSFTKLTNAVNLPAWITGAEELAEVPVKTGRRKKADIEYVDHPHIGRNGTTFRAKVS